ncbi:non-canonical purine NTP pyrophosphatase [bacterium]|nr:non-canonical purine NTP pyrophosphatase [bacterium]
MPFDVRFVTNNVHKVAEARSILAAAGVHVVHLAQKVDELQTIDTAVLVKDKTLKAFANVGRPLFVEHTGLYLRHLNDLPGGLTQIFWDKLESDRFAELFGNTADTFAIAKTVIGFTDGRGFFTFAGSIAGNIAPDPRGPRDFQWDCVFIPEGEDKTFAEMGDRKNEISMRRAALDDFATFLKERGRV